MATRVTNRGDRNTPGESRILSHGDNISTNTIGMTRWTRERGSAETWLRSRPPAATLNKIQTVTIESLTEDPSAECSVAMMRTGIIRNSRDLTRPRGYTKEAAVRSLSTRLGPPDKVFDSRKTHHELDIPASPTLGTLNINKHQRWAKFPDGSRFWKPVRGTMRKQRPIFVAATRQHVGKTTCSLALMSGLTKRYAKVGFLKTVGQQHVAVKSNNDETLQVDKDCVLVKEYFKLDHIDYHDISPVIIPKGYTKRFVDGEVSLEEQIKAVEKAMTHVTAASDVVLCEGTGHCAVGSIVGLNNAKVASLIGADMVLVANGGLGSAFDELELNRILCQHYNVRIAGVIINKVIPDKYDQTKHYMRKAMMKAWGVPLLGCIPDHSYLGRPALADLENLFKTKLISGEEHRFRHYDVRYVNIVTTSLTRFLENLRDKHKRTLYICHVTRDDLIVGFLGEYQRMRKETEKPFEAALLICGRRGKYQLSNEVTDMLRSVQGAPILIVDYATYDAMNMIHDYTPKLNIHDTERVKVAVEHYEPYINFEELMRRTQSDNSSFNEPGSPTYSSLLRI